MRTSFTTPLFGAVLLLTLAVAACGGAGSSVGPSSPTPTRPPDPTYTVSGVVLAGSAPVEGVLVRIAGQSGTTNGNGYYGVSGVPASYGGVSAVKAGYAAVFEILTVSGDTRHDFQLGPRVAIYTLSGVVSELTPTGLVPVEGVLLEESSCEDVPPATPSSHKACPVYISQTTKTDKRGLYSFSGLYPGQENAVWASKEGFEDPFPQHYPENPEGGQAVTIDDNTRFDIHLVRRHVRRLPLVARSVGRQ